MSRWEFMRRLEELLSDISPNEREEALQYYNDYFNDAGKENEKGVVDALGSPEQVARIVKEGLGDNANQGEFTENGFVNMSSSTQNEIVKRTQNGNTGKGNSGDDATKEGAESQREEESERGSEKGNNGYAYSEGAYGQGGGTSPQSQNSDSGKEGKDGMPTWAIVLLVIGCVFFSPVIIGAVCAAGAAILGVIAAVIGIIFGTGLATLILYIVAVSLVIAGFSCMFAHPLTGIGLLGGGFLCGALGILFMLLTGFLAGKCLPGICQGIAYIFKKLFGNKGGARA